MSDAKSRGRFVWYDLMTSEPEKAVQFYTKVAGWGTAAWEGPAPYTMWTNSSKPIGGVMKLPPNAGAPPHWIGYIATPDLDHTVIQSTNLGGRVMVPPTEIPRVGRFSVMTDPQGAMFAAYTSADAHGDEGPPEVGEFSWHELATRDHPAALRFYEILFGWNKGQTMDMGGGMIYQLFRRNGVDFGGMYDKPVSEPGAAAWLYYIRVPDIAKALDTVKANGGQVLHGPMDVPGGGTIAQCTDPQHARFAVHAIK